MDNSKPKQLYRSRKNRVIAGVAGGLAEYFHLDATLVRLIFVLLTIMTGGGFILFYLLAIVIMPLPPESKE